MDPQDCIGVWEYLKGLECVKPRGDLILPSPRTRLSFYRFVLTMRPKSCDIFRVGRRPMKISLDHTEELYVSQISDCQNKLLQTKFNVPPTGTHAGNLSLYASCAAGWNMPRDGSIGITPSLLESPCYATEPIQEMIICEMKLGFAFQGLTWSDTGFSYRALRLFKV